MIRPLSKVVITLDCHYVGDIIINIWIDKHNNIENGSDDPILPGGSIYSSQLQEYEKSICFQ